MECNRDEAVRAKEMAEKKIAASDFVGARKYVEMAQRLFPGLDGLSQVLAVVEVQAAAQDKVATDSNWYGILQIDSTADDSLIKKQYRKLALLLHPDKNKGVGAEAAFKVISEALGVLSDKGRRAAYDIRLKTATTRKAQGANAGRGKNASHYQYQQQQQQKQFQQQQQSTAYQFEKTGNFYGSSSNPVAGAFFITCPYCHDISGCLTINRNKPVQCLKCRRYYIAVDMRPEAAQVPSSGFNQQQVPGFGSQNISGWPPGTSVKEPSSHGGAPPQIPRQSGFGVSAEVGTSADPGPGFAEQAQANGTGAYVQNVWNTVQKQKAEAEKKRKEKEAKRLEKEEAKKKAREEEEQRRKVEKERKDREKQEQAAKAKLAKDAKEAARKRELEVLKQRRKALDEKLDARKKEEGRQKGPKRIRRVKNGSDDELEYDEVPELDDDVDLNLSTKEGSERHPPPSSHFVRRSARNRNKVSYRIDSDDEDDGHVGTNGHAPAHQPTSSACEPGSGAECTDQVLGGAGPGLQEHRSDHADDDMTGDVGKSMPADPAARKDDLSSSLRRKDTSFQQPQPSNPPPQPQHQSPQAKIMQPQVKVDELGEEINPVKKTAKQADQSVDAKHKSAENTMDEKQKQVGDIGDGKHKRAGSTLDKKQKRVGDIVDGKQKQVGNSVDVIEKQAGSTARGSASVAHDLHGKDNFPAKHEVLETGQSSPVEQLQTGCTLSHPPRVLQETGVSHESDVSKEDCDLQTETKEMFVPDPDFYDFDQDRLEEDIHKSQVWALYDDIDGMPRYYARINRVTRTPKFSCSASWFEAVSEGKSLVNGDILSAGCGKYSLGRPGKHSSVSVFSHRVEIPEPVDSFYRIYPKEGEVWAVYKQEWLQTGKEQPEDTKEQGSGWPVPIFYEMVVVEATYTDSIGVEVCYLSKIVGFKTMFQRNMERSQVKFAPPEISRRFSHKVPHHICTGNESDQRKVPAGAWELDPAATPLDLIYPTENSRR